jgi:hypothetical protein
MLTASSFLTTLGVAAAIGAALTAYLWRVRLGKLEARAGILTLAGMRWREFSNFVVDALQAQGFEADRHPPEQSAQKTHLRLSRGDQTWLLSCKQGPGSRVSGEQIESLLEAIRFNSAAGGILATLGSISGDARKKGQSLELLDGTALWELIEPLLPTGLRGELSQQARRRVVREIGVVWILALLLGMAASALLSPSPRDTPAPPSPPPVAAVQSQPAVEAPADDDAATPPQPSSDEDQQRERIAERVAQVPGVARAIWTTRSTLVLHLAGEVADDEAADDEARVKQVCAILDEYEALRSSRLQFQPPEGSTRGVRFMQCRVY